MSKAKTINGKDLMIFMDDKATSGATSHKLSVKADTVDTSSKDDGLWDDSIVTKMSWEASTEALVSFDKDASSYDKLFEKMLLGEPVDLVSGIPANKANELPQIGWEKPGSNQVYYSGKALIISLDWTASKGESVKMTVAFKGVGPLNPHNPEAAQS